MKNITGLQWSAANGMKQENFGKKSAMHKCLPDAVARMVILFFDRVAAQKNISNPRVAFKIFARCPFFHVVVVSFSFFFFFFSTLRPYKFLFTFVHDLGKLIRIFLVALSIFVSLSEMKIKLKFVGSPGKLNRTIYP